MAQAPMAPPMFGGDGFIDFDFEACDDEILSTVMVPHPSRRQYDLSWCTESAVILVEDGFI